LDISSQESLIILTDTISASRTGGSVSDRGEEAGEDVAQVAELLDALDAAGAATCNINDNYTGSNVGIAEPRTNYVL